MVLDTDGKLLLELPVFSALRVIGILIGIVAAVQLIGSFFDYMEEEKVSAVFLRRLMRSP